MKQCIWIFSLALLFANHAVAAKESCGLDDHFNSPRDFRHSRVLAESNAAWECSLLSLHRAVRVSAWRDRHSDGGDCARDSITGDCVPGSWMYAPVNQSCALFSCR